MQTIRFESSYEEPYPLEVQGESHYQENIEDVTNYLGEDEGVKVDDLIAHLILEDGNVNDSNAVRVEIDGKTVGRLSRPAAQKYRARLGQLGLVDVIGECDASARGGGYKRSTGDQMDIGIRLDLDLDAFEPVKPRTASEPTPVATIVSDSVPVPAAAATPGPAPAQKSKINPVLRVILIIIGIFLACFCIFTLWAIYAAANS